MKIFPVCKKLSAVIFCFFIFSFTAVAQHEKGNATVYKEDPFHYAFRLNFNEYSVLNGALVSGLNKHGGALDYGIKMAIAENEIAWLFTISDKNGINDIHYFLMEKKEEWQKAVKDDSTNENKKTALNVLEALIEKISDAHANPVLDIDKVAGVLKKNGDKWLIEDSLGSYELKGNIPTLLEGSKGKTIVCFGYKNGSAQFELVRFVEKKENTLELFVMSQCPVAQQVESGLFKFMEDNPVLKFPRMEFHYIFYPPGKGGQRDFTSLHGEAEIKENLVQILIRDHHPEIFTNYLKSRLKNKTASWEELLRELKVNQVAIQAISLAITRDRRSLIEKEYNYVMGVHRVKDGSPTFVWESQELKDITTIKAFKDITFSVPPDAGCSN